MEGIATNDVGRYGVEIKIDSLQGDGSPSWVVIGRGIVKHVTEASEEDGDEHDDADTCSTTGTPVATNTS